MKLWIKNQKFTWIKVFLRGRCLSFIQKMVFRSWEKWNKWSNAVAVASSDNKNQPNVRMVLLKGISNKGFILYKFISKKASKNASMCHWKSQRYNNFSKVEEATSKQTLF